MNKLTADECREQIAEFQHLLESESISTKAERHLQAYQIALPVLEQQEKGGDGWIEWGGNNAPVSYNAIVDIRWLDGVIETGVCRHFYWGRNCINPIVAYRVVQQERERGEEE